KLSGKISGSKNPGTFSSSDSCLTIYFHSDVSVPCDGWEAFWTTRVDPLLPPVFVSPPAASCNDNTLGIRFDQRWNCDSIRAGNFLVSGPLSPSITSITPVNCDANNETDSFVLNLSSVLDRSGNYRVDFDAVRYDQCDSAWQLHSDTTFAITDCPIVVDLTADPDTVCRGTCTEITADVTGGDSTRYVFTWTSGINGTYGPHTYCPTASGWVKLTVSDGVAVPGSDSVWIEVVDPPVAQNDTTVCEAAPAFNLSATPTGGYWTGNGVADTSTGLFNPSLAGAGTHWITYHFAGCTDRMRVTVIAFDAGFPNASCPGLSPFMVTGHNPAGGTWSGPNITSAGLFDPVDTGAFVVTYTWNGCVDTKTINVYPVSSQEFDTVCQSVDSVRLNFSPIGGVWTGPGFRNNQSGWFHPSLSGSGSKTLIYDANGCRDTTYMYVKPINARWNQVACPNAPPFNVHAGLPGGGFWTGMGITDSFAGTYDATFIYALNRTWYNDTITYHVNGCTDRKIVYVRRTVVNYDTVKFCIEDPRIVLNWSTTRRSPGGGRWTGPGVTGTAWFTPALAGRGNHKLYYDANGCRDSIIMHVYPESVIQNDTILCETDNVFDLFEAEVGGYWNGNGIVDTASGLFDPAIAGVGIHRIYYVSRNGCLDSCDVQVDPRPIVTITNYDPIYCFRDTTITIGATPLGGVWTGTTYGDSLFNPNHSGSGNHKFHYRYGTPTCYSEDSVVVQVLDTLKGSFTFDDDSLCHGEQATLVAGGLRGSGNPYTYSWSASSSTDRSIFTRPSSSRWVVATIGDGCSDAYKDSVYLHIFPKINVDVLTSDTQCYGTVGFAEVTPRLTDPYSMEWFTDPSRFTNRIDALVSNTYNFRVRNLLTQCYLDSGVYIPSYPRLNAHFITSPAEGFCLNPFDPEVQIINYSTGATSGTWYFGDSTFAPYQTGSNPIHRYSVDTNVYRIWLYVQNRGGCRDSFSLQVCVDDSVYVVIPNAFSPGTDGINDFYSLRTAGVVQFEMAIFNRWGERVFETFDKNFSWDGSYRGVPLPSGVYPYYIKYKGKKTVRKLLKGTINVVR
ncbi:MAG: gliding motility-associated C-terminal domain-containing protein, partial [Bacteroidia bacterium]|nr:gliding motility-associated C-terminal domain-containing protein [Bacteroidia bacterium]